MFVPMFEDLLGWTEFETSLFFCGAGVIVSNEYVRIKPNVLCICDLLWYTV